MENLSVVIITYNEERNIARCLESVLGVGDEIVVVDSFSDDATEQICKSYDVKFVQREWSGFSSQKNFADDLALNDWILSIDADEVLSDELRASIVEVMEDQLLSDDTIFSMNRLSEFCHRWIHHSGWYPDRKVRIWNKRVGKWHGSIHETLVFSKDVHEVHLTGDLLHYIDYTEEGNRLKMQRYTDLSSQNMFEQRKKSSLFKVYYKTVWTFINCYIVRLGFLDGEAGYKISKNNALSTYLKYKKLHELWRK